jgi:hypothetical protein
MSARAALEEQGQELAGKSARTTQATATSKATDKCPSYIGKGNGKVKTDGQECPSYTFFLVGLGFNVFAYS